MPLSEEQIKVLLNSVEETRKTTDKIERGVYGDAANGVKGLIEHHRETDVRIGNIERWVTASKMKVAYVSGFVAAIMIGIRMFWEWLTGPHTK